MNRLEELLPSPTSGSRICPLCAPRYLSGDRVGSEQMEKICKLPLKYIMANTPKGEILKQHLASPADQKKTTIYMYLTAAHSTKEKHCLQQMEYFFCSAFVRVAKEQGLSWRNQLWSFLLDNLTRAISSL